jgi:hypothetical protein
VIFLMVGLMLLLFVDEEAGKLAAKNGSVTPPPEPAAAEAA